MHPGSCQDRLHCPDGSTCWPLLRKGLRLPNTLKTKPQAALFRHNVGALIIRIGFWGFLVINIVEHAPNPLENIKPLHWRDHATSYHNTMRGLRSLKQPFEGLLKMSATIL